MIPTTLILATGHTATNELAALENENGELRIDRQIRQTLREKRYPLIVMADDGDELLRASRLLRQCEFVFDPNAQMGFLSHLRAGLLAAARPAYFIRAETSLLSPLGWSYFEAEMNTNRAQDCHLLTNAADPNEWMDAPGLVTRKGLKLITDLSIDELKNHTLEIQSARLCVADADAA